MKRIVTLLLAAGLVLGAFGGAQAADIKAKGSWAFDFAWSDNLNYSSSKHGGAGEDDFGADQRFRTQIDVIASEALYGTVYFEIGTSQWGNTDAALGADGKSVKVKRSYIDWTVPQTDLKIRMGIQGLSLPGAVTGSSTVFDDDVAALTASYAFNDMVSVTAFWARPYNTDGSSSEKAVSGSAHPNTHDEFDMFGFVVPVALDGFKVTPYFAYASVGRDVALDLAGDFLTGTGYTNNSASQDAVIRGVTTPGQLLSLAGGGSTGWDTTATAWWSGFAFEMSRFDPFSLKLDFDYGKLSAEESFADRSGFQVSALAEYKLGMVTPGLLAWYGSGEDDDASNGSERMPSVSPQGWAPTSFGFPGSNGPTYDTNFGQNGAGTWALGLQLADISFLENLSHVARVVYMKGTNDADLIKQNAGLNDVYAPAAGAVFLTNKDSAWEVNFDTKYKIYDNLSVFLELGYIKLNMDDDTWGANIADNIDDAWKAAFVVKYDF